MQITPIHINGYHCMTRWFKYQYSQHRTCMKLIKKATYELSTLDLIPDEMSDERATDCSLQ